MNFGGLKFKILRNIQVIKTSSSSQGNTYDGEETVTQAHSQDILSGGFLGG